MKELHKKGVAHHLDLESSAGRREAQWLRSAVIQTAGGGPQADNADRRRTTSASTVTLNSQMNLATAAQWIRVRLTPVTGLNGAMMMVGGRRGVAAADDFPHAADDAGVTLARRAARGMNCWTG